MATAQLALITPERSWKLDRQTVEVGRAGVAQARAVLAEIEARRAAEAAEAAAQAEAEAAKVAALASRTRRAERRQHNEQWSGTLFEAMGLDRVDQAA
jgi:hypothetical protein